MKKKDPGFPQKEVSGTRYNIPAASMAPTISWVKFQRRIKGAKRAAHSGIQSWAAPARVVVRELTGTLRP